MAETRSTRVGKKSTGPTAVGSIFSVSEKKLTGSATVGDVNENKETDEPVMVSNESSIDNLRYQIGGLGDQMAISQGQQQAFLATVDNSGRYIPPPIRLGYQDQYGHGMNGQGEIYMAGEWPKRRNDDVASQNGPTQYEDILNEEYQHKNSLKGTYYKDPNLDINLVELEDLVKDNTTEVRLAEVVATRPYMCRGLVKYENRDPEVGLLGAPSGKFEYYMQYSKPDSYHQYPIKHIGWDLDKPRQHDVHSIDRHTKRRDWTVKTFKPLVKEDDVTAVKQVEEDRIVYPLDETNVKDDVAVNSSSKISKDKNDDFSLKLQSSMDRDVEEEGINKPEIVKEGSDVGLQAAKEDGV
ncbi:hypothetical protein FNV43_RR01395 [Rhamnella rubrinervis]|uniref:Uncharacterized protein n=1 Tax=Rhamnella rubrinervis TaxID=2594499 RepID=A0A8K0MS04_9ROSA|nr:hypothetical protein FNV43_RR01395 [Rhamnella rubrinervis]